MSLRYCRREAEENGAGIDIATLHGWGENLRHKN
jgi:hypothetical protein